jgi:CRISPR/Cas system CSM-associated protein Csm5 (group 7 of RAMP superfamily)
VEYRIAENDLEKEKKEIFDRASKITERFTKMKSSLNNFIKESAERIVYWYGTGLASATLFGMLDDEIRSSHEFIVIDSDPRREGLIFTPSGSEVRLAGEFLKNKQLKMLVIATSLHGEVINYLKDLNCFVSYAYKYNEFL